MSAGAAPAACSTSPSSLSSSSVATSCATARLMPCPATDAFVSWLTSMLRPDSCIAHALVSIDIELDQGQFREHTPLGGQQRRRLTTTRHRGRCGGALHAHERCIDAAEPRPG